MSCPKCGRFADAYHACPSLPVVTRDDLLAGTKYAALHRAEDRPWLAGVGRSTRYDTEAYAVCGRDNPHRAPDPLCQCGFWIPVAAWARYPIWHRTHLALEVEFGGTVLECSKRGGEVHGYRAQWQRVLSARVHPHCAASPACSEPGTTLVHTGRANSHFTVACWPACVIHAHHPGTTIIPSPVSWLRQLRTEIRPANLTDDPPVLPSVLPDALPVTMPSGGIWSLQPQETTTRWTLLPGQAGDGIAAMLAGDGIQVPVPVRNHGAGGAWRAVSQDHPGVEWAADWHDRCLIITRTLRHTSAAASRYLQEFRVY